MLAFCPKALRATAWRTLDRPVLEATDGRLSGDRRVWAQRGLQDPVAVLQEFSRQRKLSYISG